MDILVLGIGNILLTDEGVGVRTIETLENQYRFPEGVEFVDGGTAGFELMSMIANRDHLILVDAVSCGYPPGTVLRIEGDDVRKIFGSRISPHQLGISDVLAAASLTGELPRHLVLFGVEPECIDTGLELSEKVTAVMPKLLDSILHELEDLGCRAFPREMIYS